MPLGIPVSEQQAGDSESSGRKGFVRRTTVLRMVGNKTYP